MEIRATLLEEWRDVVKWEEMGGRAVKISSVAFVDVGEICLLTVRCPGRLDRLVKYSESTVDILWYCGHHLVQWIPSGTVEIFWYSRDLLVQ